MNDEETCKALTYKGKRCKMKATVFGYCPFHFAKYQNIKKRKKALVSLND